MSKFESFHHFNSEFDWHRKQNNEALWCGHKCSSLSDLTNPCLYVTGRKLKRFGALKALGLPSSLMFQSHLAMSNNNQALTTMSCIPGIREVQLSQQIINILENIEPETMYSGYDSTQSDVPHLLLNSLNRLCEKQLLWIVKWSKTLPGNSSVQLMVTAFVAMGTHRQASPKVSAFTLKEIEGFVKPSIPAITAVSPSGIKPLDCHRK